MASTTYARLICALLLALVVSATPALPQEGEAEHCDNDASSKSKGVHNCECERTSMSCDKDKHDPATVYMSEKCSTKCFPDRCTCSNMSCAT